MPCDIFWKLSIHTSAEQGQPRRETTQLLSARASHLFCLSFELLRVVLAKVSDPVLVQSLDVGRRFQLGDDNQSRLSLGMGEGISTAMDRRSRAT